MSAKRNLLLGILALQSNFINRSQLIAAFNAWVEDKSKALGDLLVEQQALKVDEHALLEALAAKHLDRHGQDSDKSLAALSYVGSAHRHLAKIADADVQESLASLAMSQAAVRTLDYDSHPNSARSREHNTGIPGRFRILRLHAKGGLGNVSVAVDQELNREVALKEIKGEHADNRDAQSRFLLEAEITGGLEHPGIVPVYSLGTYADGRPFYAMRFIKGDSLKEAIHAFHNPKPRGESVSPDYHSITFRKLLGRFVDVCNAIAYAHSRGVLHRDLKPGNIMLGKYGETLVVDWGLAKVGVGGSGAGRTDEQPATPESLLRPTGDGNNSDTLPGAALGTPAFMSPEQAAGRLDQLGPAADVYSLGATLYNLLAGRLAFSGEVAEVLKKVQAGRFSPPREAQPAIPSALEAVCLKAMALKLADRYGLVRELAEEVERWLADEPVRAWPEPWTIKARRWTSRHRVLVSSAAACLVVAAVALIAGMVVVSQANADLENANQTIREKERETGVANTGLVKANADLGKANQETTIANTNLVKANVDIKAANEANEDQLATTRMMLARSRFEENQASLAEDLLEQVPPKLRFMGWGLLKNYVAGSLFTLHGHTHWVTSVAFAADGQVLASASYDKTVKLWDTRTGQEFRTLRGHTSAVTRVAFAGDGKVLASAGWDKTVKLWDARTGQELHTLRGHIGEVTSVAFAADGLVLASASGQDKTVKLWDARTGQELRTLRGHSNFVASVAFAADGRVLATASNDSTVKLWDARTGQELRTLRGHRGGVTSVAFAVDGSVLALASGSEVKLWDVETGRELRTLRGNTDAVASVAFSSDGQVLASASRDKTIKLWDTRTGHELRTLSGHTGAVTSVAFAADGQMLASASYDNTIKLWDARTGPELRTLRGHTHFVKGVAFAADGQLLATASQDGTVKVWDARTGQELRTLRGHTFLVASVAFGADGQVLASASWDKTVKLWDVRTGQELRTLSGHTDSIASVAFSSDGQLLASASRDKTIKLWDARTGQELRSLRGHTGPVTSVAFAADGQVLASASSDRTVKLWDTRTGQELRTLPGGHTRDVWSVAFAANSQILASAGGYGDNTVKLWDARTGQELRTLRGHADSVTSVMFAPDGQVVASASADKTVRLWDVRTGQELRTLRGHSDGVESVAFARDGQLLASASQDQTVTLWDTRTGQEILALHGHTDIIRSVAFAADSQVLASASGDKTVKLWDARTGQELRTLRGHTYLVTSVAFAANGQVLASASIDNTVKLWDTRTGHELRTLRGHTGSVFSVAFAANGQVLASASYDRTVKLWDTRTGHELRTLHGHSGWVTSVTLAADGSILWSRDQFGKALAWDAATGKQLPDAPPMPLVPDGPGAWSPDGNLLAVGQDNGMVLLVPRAISEKERCFRLLVTAPDLQLHRERAEQADKGKQPLALAFRLGRYLAGKNYYAAEPKEAAMLAGWLGTAAQSPGLLPGLPALVKTPFHEPTFPDAIACTGVLYMDSGIVPERLLIGTSRALAGDPSNWPNHAFHGGALFRKGEHAKALAALTEAVRLHGKPSPLTHNLLALVSLKMGQKEKAEEYLKQAQPAKDAPWEDITLHRLFQPEVEAALAKGDGKQQSPKEK